jgi:protein-tyrosine-phosphatase
MNQMTASSGADGRHGTGQPERRILFVCTGNTCRSPMAEVLLRDMAEKRGLADAVEVMSAGIYPVAGDPATAGAIAAVKTLKGIDLRGHSARLLDARQLQEATVVLAMTQRHVESIRDAFPDLAERVYTLKAYAGHDVRDTDISDPYGTSDENYLACAREILAALERAEEKLLG